MTLAAITCSHGSFVKIHVTSQIYFPVVAAIDDVAAAVAIVIFLFSNCFVSHGPVIAVSRIVLSKPSQ